jgi:hypothetical protein
VSAKPKPDPLTVQCPYWGCRAEPGRSCTNVGVNAARGLFHRSRAALVKDLAKGGDGRRWKPACMALVCEECGAEPWEECRTSTGERRTHKARSDALRRAYEAQDRASAARRQQEREETAWAFPDCPTGVPERGQWYRVRLGTKADPKGEQWRIDVGDGWHVVYGAKIEDTGARFRWTASGRDYVNKGYKAELQAAKLAAERDIIACLVSETSWADHIQEIEAALCSLGEPDDAVRRVRERWNAAHPKLPGPERHWGFP